MAMFKRFGFFILTNFLVIVTIGIIWSIVSTFFGIGDLSSNPNLLIYCFIWGMAGSFISLWMSKWSAKSMYGVKLIDSNERDPELRRLVERVHQFSQQAGITKMPEVGYYESPDLNAFATGPTKNRSLVAVSTGLLRNMNNNELDGVLAHEVAHIANGDMVTMTLIQGVVNAFVLFFSKIVARIVANSVDEKLSTLVRFGIEMAAYIAFAFLGAIIVNYFSRYREFRADAGGAKFSSRENMLAALQKLQAAYELPLPPDETTTATLMISNRTKGGFSRFFATHPPLSERIQALKTARI